MANSNEDASSKTESEEDIFDMKTLKESLMASKLFDEWDSQTGIKGKHENRRSVRKCSEKAKKKIVDLVVNNNLDLK